MVSNTNSEDCKGLNYKSHPNRFIERAFYVSTVNKTQHMITHVSSTYGKFQYWGL